MTVVHGLNSLNTALKGKCFSVNLDCFHYKAAALIMYAHKSVYQLVDLVPVKFNNYRKANKTQINNIILGGKQLTEPKLLLSA